ncbi:MAG TPA: bifunctional [glutamine synthetase] adenylyltransferase/[glutamine synthetase]-adenylyl-L-tyrosine phosphorylase [Caulobacteraceae bacterium]
MTQSLAASLHPCGPVCDEAAAERVRGRLAGSGREAGWLPLLDQAWPQLAPVFAASPYLAGLAFSDGARLRHLLARAPKESLEHTIESAAAASNAPETAASKLRRLKKDFHLLTALADLGGVWSLEEVTGALTRFADATIHAALAVVATEEAAKGRLLPPPDGGAGPVPGLFCLAMGKHGGFELNYSSDIDISIFYEPEALPLAPGVEPAAFAARLAQNLAKLLSERTAEGYVFRVDLRLRPDPASTPAAVPAEAALDYYRTIGQNWERAAFIKARPCAGDLPRAHVFLKELQPFIWRRTLDFAAIADIHSIKRQIFVHKIDERLTAPGADLKLGAGGIREIEFFVQIQQLILGGRNPALRSSHTLDALAALAEAGHVAPATARELTEAYRELRRLEHRIQMIADEQTHRLPEDPAARRRVAALAGYGDLRRFDSHVSRILKLVNRRYGELFAEDEPLASRFGSLVFTGVEDDPETLVTLRRMGFSNPSGVSAAIRSWHHGRIPATRGERGRELLTRLAPRLLDAMAASGAPDAAFARFAAFFETVATGVQVQSMLLAEPKLLELVVRVLAFAPRLARTLARRAAVLDSLLDAAFFARFEEGKGEAALTAAAAEAHGYEGAMDAIRRVHAEQAFRIGVQVISGRAAAAEAGPAYADLADLCIRALAPAALAEAERLGGAFAGEVAVVALGKCGAREMTATSDLDLMTLYVPAAPDALSAAKGWSADVFYARFTQRLIAALSAPTAEGPLYEIDMQLRPSGSKGPVAVHLPAFEDYYEGHAETWEFMAMTRARVAWATSEDFAARCAAVVEHILRRPRDLLSTRKDVGAMRELVEAEKPAAGRWDLKYARGGLMDIEFAAQFLQLARAPEGGPIAPNTGEALRRLHHAGLLRAGEARPLLSAWTLQLDLQQVLRLAINDRSADPSAEPAAFRKLLARAGHAAAFAALEARLSKAQHAARAAYERLLAPPRDGNRRRGR